MHVFFLSFVFCSLLYSFVPILPTHALHTVCSFKGARQTDDKQTGAPEKVRTSYHQPTSQGQGWDKLFKGRPRKNCIGKQRMHSAVLLFCTLTSPRLTIDYYFIKHTACDRGGVHSPCPMHRKECRFGSELGAFCLFLLSYPRAGKRRLSHHKLLTPIAPNLAVPGGEDGGW